MMKNRRIKAAALALASLLFICSCDKYEEIPELKEPVTGTQTFRPVTKRNVGTPYCLFGSVAATEYCHFYKKPVEIKSINVELGEFVNEGDVLAVADVDSVKNQIADIKGQLSLLDVENEQKKVIHESTLRELELERNWTEYLKNLGYADQKDIDEVDKSIDNENENFDYDLKMYEFMKKNYNDSLKDLNEIVSDGSLKAKKSGYVSYVKNLKEGRVAKIYENIVVVSDYDDLYIQSDITTQSYAFLKYEAKFMLYKGEKTEITEYEYSDSEKAYAKAQGVYPTMRFKPVGDVDLTIGDEFNLFFYKEYAKDALAIGKDSAQSDDEGSFVYVKMADGTLEKRYYEPGVTDKYYIEVLSGLEEGELVLYEQTAPLPKKNDTWEATTSDLRMFKQVKGIKYEENKSETYLSEESGEIDTIYVKSGDEIKKGDPIMKIAIDSDKADNVKIENDITHLKESYKIECDEYDKSLEEIEKQLREKNEQIKNLSSKLDEVKKEIEAGDLSKIPEKEQLEYSINELYNLSNPYLGYGTVALEEEKIILAANRAVSEKTYNVSLDSLLNKQKEQKKKNDGSGYKTVYATEDGIVETVKVSEHDMVDANKPLAVVSSYYDKFVYNQKISDKLPLEFKMTIAGEDRDYKGSVVQSSWDGNPNIFTENGKVYCTQSMKQGYFFVFEVEDEEFHKNMLDDYTADLEVLRIENSMIIPADYINEETDYEGKKSYFVWKLENDEFVKEYVVIEDGLNMYNALQGVEEGDILAK